MPLPPQNNSNRKSGSGFTNLNKYLQANQANRLGQTVSAGVQRAGGDARSSLTQANQEFQARAADEQNRLAQQGTKVNDVLGGDIAKASDDDVKNFENIRNAEYKGPGGVADANALRSKAGEAEMLGRAGSSEAGRFGLLQRFVGAGNPQYSAGSQRLDQMLLGQTGQQQLRGARSATAGLNSQADQSILGAQARGDELRGGARQLAESTIGRLGEQATSYDAAMKQQLADKKAGINSLLGGIQTGGNSAVEVDENVLNQLKEVSGGALDEGTGLYKADLSPYLKFNELYATKQGVQGQDDLAKVKRLGALTGNSLAGKDSGTALQDYLGHEDMAGSFAANNPFDVTSQPELAAALAKAKGDYDSARGAQGTIMYDRHQELMGNVLPDYINNTGSYNKLIDQRRIFDAEKGAVDAYDKQRKDQYQQQFGNTNGFQASDISQVRAQHPNDYEQTLAKYNPEWYNQKKNEFDYANLIGATQGPSRDSSDYIKKSWGHLQPEIADAKAWAATQGHNIDGDPARRNLDFINAQEASITEARNKYDNLLPKEFNALRMLKKKASVT